MTGNCYVWMYIWFHYECVLAQRRFRIDSRHVECFFSDQTRIRIQAFLAPTSQQTECPFPPIGLSRIKQRLDLDNPFLLWASIQPIQRHSRNRFTHGFGDIQMCLILILNSRCASLNFIVYLCLLHLIKRDIIGYHWGRFSVCMIVCNHGFVLINIWFLSGWL